MLYQQNFERSLYPGEDFTYTKLVPEAADAAGRDVLFFGFFRVSSEHRDSSSRFLAEEES